MKKYYITYTADCDVNYEIKVHFAKEFINKKSAVLWSNLCSNIILSENALDLTTGEKPVYRFNVGEYDFLQLTEERKKKVPPAILIDDIRKMDEDEKNKLFTNTDYYYSDEDYVKVNCSINCAYKELCQSYGAQDSFSFSILSYSVTRSRI